MSRPTTRCTAPHCDEQCGVCGGSGEVEAERREDHTFRALLLSFEAAVREPLLRQIHDADAFVTLRTDQVNERDRAIRQLKHDLAVARDYARKAERECDRLRVIVQAQARLLDSSIPERASVEQMERAQ